MFRLAFVFLLLAAIPLRANLGETVGDCVKRYGKPVGYSEAGPRFPFGTLIFTAGGYTLVVFLHGDKEVGARVTKKDNSAFSGAELKSIMDADSTVAGWTPATSTDASSLNWTRGDKATALYDHDKHVLIFTSEEMTNLAHAIPAKADATPPTNAPSAATTNAPASAPAN